MATVEAGGDSLVASAGGTRDEDMLNDDVHRLELRNVVGYSGERVVRSLRIHPDTAHMIYPIGCNLIIEDVESNQQQILSGHDNFISTLTVSRSGEYIATGQHTHMGFKADIIVWHYPTKSRYATFNLHRMIIQSLAFSANDKYLVSLGGKDDANVVVWDIATKEAVCGSRASTRSAGPASVVACCHENDDVFVTGGDNTLRVWTLDLRNRKIHPQDINMGQMRRNVECVEVLPGDKFAICGTTTGDILKINMETALLAKSGPSKNRFSQTIKCICVLRNGDLLIGAGDGTFATFNFETMTRGRTGKVPEGGVSGLAVRGQGHHFYIGTTRSQIYMVEALEFELSLYRTCQPDGITDVCFPAACSDLYVTCGLNDIRVWHAHTSKELLRITVPNMLCTAICVQNDGGAIISSWSDGKIRAFYPETGRPMWTIENAHTKGVSALCVTNDSKRVISGGGEGQVRVWNVTKDTQRMAEALKEHKGKVTMIKVRQSGAECVSASVDGTCIIWDLKRFVRNQVIFASALFQNVCYHPSECQVIATGTDRRVGYWETFDGSVIREIEASTASVYALDISSDGSFFVSGGGDKLVKLWYYMDGVVSHIGVGHSGTITRIKICPNSRYIVSVSADGCIMRWDFPSIPRPQDTLPGLPEESNGANGVNGTAH